VVAPTIALAVPWCPWIPERRESMARLRYALGICSEYDRNEPQAFTSATSGATAGYREFGDKLPNDVWSEQVFTWLASTDADWCMQIQEDAVIPPNFWACVRAIIEAAPEGTDIIGLHVCHPFAEHLAKEGSRIFTSAEGLVGVCYLVRGSAMREFVEWRKTKLADGWRTPTPPKGLPSITEDTMLGMFALSTGRRVLHTIPAIVDHDTEMKSVWGNDDHENRRPRVRWDAPEYLGKSWTPKDLEDPAWWKGGPSIPHVGRLHEATPRLCRRWVEGFDHAAYVRAQADDGSPLATGMKYRMLAKAYREPKAKLYVGTPHRGALHPEYVASILRLQRMLGLDVLHDLAFDPGEGGGGLRMEHDDLVRVRSRMLRLAYESGATHLLMADSDVSFAPQVVAAMISTGKDFIQAPYLRRDGGGYTLRALPHEREAGPRDVQPDSTVEIEGTGLGLTLITRSCMERVLAHYGGGDLDFLDVVDGLPYLTTALFQTMIADHELLSEDMSFAKRWRDVGGKVWLYVGQGTPIAHYGSVCHQGRIEDLGFVRTG
jgi:hypothetical protein